MNPATATPRFSWPQVSARRLERNGLAAPLKGAGPAGPAAVMCGAHAQVLSAAELSIGMRMAEGTRADVRHALWTERTLVKTRGPRGTVHLLSAQDLPMWTGALSALPGGRSTQGQASLLTPDQTEAVVDAMTVVLADADLTVEELTEALAEEAGPWAADPVMEAFQDKWPRWFQAVDTAANRGALCFGPSLGRKVTYTSPRRWLPDFRPAEARTALTELVKRYLYAYGPATPQHFARWLAAPPRWTSDLFASLAAELQQVELEGAPAWVVAGDTAMPTAKPRGVRLLPYFDAYVIASQPRERLFPGRAYGRALAGGQAGNYPVLLVDGVAAGVWHQRRSGRKIHITVEPLGALTAAQRKELDDQVGRVGEIMEGSTELTVGTITVGPHA
ncbi:AlkZ family DNA glycosylase [Streptomyces sp. ISL-98]|uniref:winged helix DNA-binding domain-containing protein n=1 Tax=Streptomyces sp. ISL-98 TaxID=2819192 RepID=UPI001BE9D7B2|nr:winged helix DNA-binding domain-containing protein [Streptomyces sp. ISL-98]MBT2508390.1 AlkZ family DNA glycosylase [Streptomyces sp. ISL-98]